jgi:hypothetical protein
VGLTPIADCLDRRDDGVIVVWFDYELAAPDPIIVERGASNALAPTGMPPTLFGPGVHTRVVSVETRDGNASWTLAGQVASSGDQTPTCDQLAGTATTAPGTTDTTAPGTTDTTQPGTTEPGTTDTTQPGTTEPGTTEPGTTDTTQPGTTDTTQPGTATTDGCSTGERSVGGTCAPVEVVQLLLVDNVQECDGHAVARFAAVNDNPFDLDAGTFASTLSPQRLDGEQVTVLERRDEATGDTLAAEFLTVRYITSVTWTVTHDGFESAISAGVSGATPNPSCPLAAVNATGADGVLSTGTGTIPTTGLDDVVPVSLIASLLLLAGVVLVVASARRRPDEEHPTGV